MLHNKKPEQHLVLPNICLDQDEIELVSQYKYLGITIDQDLNMYSYVDLMYRMASDKLYMLRHIRKYVTEKAAIFIMKTMVLPYLDIGNCC